MLLRKLPNGRSRVRMKIKTKILKTQPPLNTKTGKIRPRKNLREL